MSLSISFYTCTANPKKLDKSEDLTAIGSALTSNTKHNIDIINPVFTVDYNADLLPANYIYISEFGRYYFITISTDTAQTMRISGTVDPLYSFAAYIENCPCTVVRSEKAGINYTVDNKLPIDPNNFRTAAEPSTSAAEDTPNSKPYVLIVNAGVND